MDLYIECPVCEQQFSTTEGPPEKQVSCPSCARKFMLSLATIIEAPQSHRHPDPESSYAPRLAVPIDLRRESNSHAQTPSDSSTPAPPKHQFATTDSTKNLIKIRAKQRSKRRFVTTLVSSAVMALVIGILFGLLAKRLNNNPIVTTHPANVENIFPSPADTNRLSQSSSTAKSKRTDKPGDRTAGTSPEIHEALIRPEDIPPLQLDFLKRKQVDECWNIVRPHLVSLNVFDSRKSHPAVATIIDSRGWILTSYSAIQGAVKIEVTASANSIEDLQEREQLTDLVRGIVAVDPANDLAILLINRRFVTALSILKTSDENRVPQGFYLVQCAPPSRDNPWGRTESEIIARADSSLPQSGQIQAKKRRLDSGQLTWLIASGQSRPLPGTPLVSVDGQVEAINVFSEKDQSYFLPVHQLSPLINSFEGNIKPLSTLSDRVADGAPPVVPVSHPMRNLSIELNLSGDHCRDFNWIPDAKQEYENLQQFAKNLDEAANYVQASRGNGDDQVKQISRQIEYWRGALSDRIKSLSDRESNTLGRMNEQFAQFEMKQADRFVPLFGNVIDIGFTTNELRIELIETKSYANVSFDPSLFDDPSMDGPPKIESYWLFLARTKPARNQRIMELPGRGKIKLESAELVFQFGPIH